LLKARYFDISKFTQAVKQSIPKEMMRGMLITILLASVAQVHATEAADKLVGKSLDELFERALKISALQHTDFDDATLGKAGVTAMQNAPSIAQPLARREATLATLGALVGATLASQPNPAQAVSSIGLQMDDKKMAVWKEGIVRRDDAMSPGNMVKGKDVTEVPGTFLRGMNARYDPKVVKYKDTYTKSTQDVSLLPGTGGETKKKR